MLNAEPSGLRILVVEDDPACAQSMVVLLRLYGHDPEIATTGEAGLEAAKSRWPDVILVDIRLPGIDGWEFARRISKEPNRARPLLIAITGFGMEDDRRRSAEAGIDLHLTKPVDPEQLQAVLKSVVLLRCAQDLRRTATN